MSITVEKRVSLSLSLASLSLSLRGLTLLEFFVLVVLAVRQTLRQKRQSAGLLSDLGEPLKKRR